MATAPQYNSQGSGLAVNFNTTTFFLFFPTATTTESQRQFPTRIAGTMSGLNVIISANTIATSATTVRTRIATANGNQSVSIGAGSTGSFQDTTNTDAISGAGQLFNYQIVTPNTSGAITVTAVNFLFAATTNTSTMYVSRNGTNIANNVSLYSVLHGGNTNQATEASAQTKFKTAGTLSKLAVRVTANSRAVTDTYRTRVNGVNGNLSLTVGASATGIFEDTANSDTINLNDLVNYQWAGGASASSVTWGFETSVYFTSTANVIQVVGGPVTTTVNANLTRYIGVGADGLIYTTESNIQALALTGSTVSNLACFISANTVSATSTLNFRKNTANGSQSVSITASTTGYFEDSSNSDTLVSSDLINYQLITGATGTSLDIQSIAMVLTLPTPVVSPLSSQFLMLLGVGT